MKYVRLLCVLAPLLFVTACGGEGVLSGESIAAPASSPSGAGLASSPQVEKSEVSRSLPKEAPESALNMIVSDLDDEVRTWQGYWASFDCERQFANNLYCSLLMEKADRIAGRGANELVNSVLSEKPEYLGEAPPAYAVLVEKYLNEAVQLEDWYEKWEAAECEYAPASCIQEAAGIALHMERMAKELSRWQSR